MNVGLLGGTFDPPHIAHLQAAEVALRWLPLDAVWFLPTGDAPHKNLTEFTPANIRCDMLRAIIGNNAQFDICPYEVDNPGPHYTVYTLSALQQQFTDCSFTFIVGSDSMAQFHRWKEPEKLFKLARIAIFERPDVPIASLEPVYRDRAVILPVVPLPISSTDLRERVKNQLSIRWLVPEAVESIILEHGLFRPNSL